MTPVESSFVACNYSVDLTDAVATSGGGEVIQSYMQNTANASSYLSLTYTGATTNQTSLWEVTEIDGNQITFKVDFYEMTAGGITGNTGTTNITMTAGGANSSSLHVGSINFGGTNSITLGAASNITVGDKHVLHTMAAVAADGDGVLITNDVTANGTYVTAYSTLQRFYVDDVALRGLADVSMRFYQIELDKSQDGYGEAKLSEIKMSFANERFRDTTLSGLKPAAGFEVAPGNNIGSVAIAETKLYDIDRFWDANGNFILENSKELLLVQGDGQTAKVSIFGSDTLGDVMDKINNAIVQDLGQGNYLTGTDDERLTTVVGLTGTTGSGTSAVSQANSEAAANIEKIIFGLKNGWLEMAAKRVEDFYGISGTGLPMDVLIYNKAAFGTIAAITYNYDVDGKGINHTLNIDAADFLPATMPDGTNTLGTLYNDRIIAHEMAHAIMSVNMD